MTLQNKQVGLLADGDTADDVVDIFDQYGSGDDLAATSTTSSVPQNVTRPASDDELEAETTEEKKWEEDFDDKLNQIAASPQPQPQPQPQSRPEPKPQSQSKANISDEQRITQEAKIAAIQKAQPKKMPAKNDKIKVVSPPTTETETREVQALEKELKEDELVSTTSSVPQPPQKKKYELSDANDAATKDTSKLYVQAHSESVHEATAATQETAQMVKQSYAPPTDKEIKAREVHVDPSKKTILIVDDDVDTMEMYAEIFEKADYNVLRAADGLEAMSLIAEHTPHVIFTGIVMPRMDGFSLMEALKQNKRTADIPVVINSHLGREEDKKRAEELGARDFIVRGFTPPREALERVGALLLRSEYVFRFDKNDIDSRKLARDLGMPNFFQCPRGQEMVLKLNIVDEKELIFSARFSCVDKRK